MTDGFQIAKAMDTITVFTEAFRLTFDEGHVGVTVYKYQIEGILHEGVEPGTTPPILFGPYFEVQNLEGDVLYPAGGSDLTLEKYPGWFVEISQKGYLRNSSLPELTDYPIEVWWRVWPSGRLCCKVSLLNDSGSSRLLLEEAYRLNPADDQDMDLGREDPPELNWFGFYSNNTGEEEDDLSHDAIVIPFQAGLDNYGTSGNTNRIYREDITWDDEETIELEFMIALSVGGSWGDITDSADFQSRGDSVGIDVLNPDPLDGSGNAGDVLVGEIVGDGYSEELGAYTVRVS